MRSAHHSEREKQHIRMLNALPPLPNQSERKAGKPIILGQALGMKPPQIRTEAPMSARGATRNTLHLPRHSWDPSRNTIKTSITRRPQRPSPTRERKELFAPLHQVWEASADPIIIDDDDTDEDVGKRDPVQRLEGSAPISSPASSHRPSPPPPWDLELDSGRSPVHDAPLPDFVTSFEGTEKSDALPSSRTSHQNAWREHDSHVPADLHPDGVETDPIESFTDEDGAEELAKPHEDSRPIPSNGPPGTEIDKANGGLVQRRVQDLENARMSGQTANVPHLNLLFAQKSVVSRMQPANRGDIATSTTRYTRGKEKNHRSVTSRSAPITSEPKSTHIHRFPIEKAFLGSLRIDHADDSSKSWVNINLDDDTLCIAIGAYVPLPPKKPDFSVGIKELVKWQICEESGACMIACQIRAEAQTIHVGPNVDFSVDDEPNITICFANHANMNNFKTFVIAIRNKVKHVDLLGKTAASRRWQMAVNSGNPDYTAPRGPAVKKPRMSEPNRESPKGPSIARRSSRRNTQSLTQEVATPGPQPPDDEVILVHAPLGGGSFHITHGDRKRLRPSEFLNDTLIEFGLRLWIDELRAQNPQLADQIHVFNSFFYNKLSAPRKKVPETYANVRKWTAKFDLFSKKYVVVPINENVHWYLAIICQPNLVLQQPLPPKEKPASPSVQTRRSKRQEERDALDSAERVLEEDTTMTGMDDQEVEGMLNVEPNTQESEPLVSKASSGIDSDIEVESTNLSTGLETPHVPTTPRFSSSPLSDMDSSPIPAVVPVKGKEPLTIPTPAAPSNFYARKAVRSEGTFFSLTDSDMDVVMEDGTSSTLPTEVSSRQDTVIFTLDSLGGKHPRVWNTLGEYLQHEAKDKKGMALETTSIARGVQAHVPTQPNFCDCGLYLLHFVKQFFTDPEGFQAALLEEAPRNAKARTDRKAKWMDKDVGSLREAYAAKIDSLVDTWRASQPAKTPPTEPQDPASSATAQAVSSSPKAPKGKTVAKDDSDDDVIITGETPAPVKARGRPKARRKSTSEDVEISEGTHVGNAERIR